jgi:CubicO group peptidase (beta-lactamase class C family)
MKVDPDGAGLDGDRLERITRHLGDKYVAPGKIAGCEVAVFRHGVVGYHRTFGSMDLERAKAVEEGTIWRIYSMTKPIAGVALMTLFEHGLFQLDDPVHRWIPEWKDLRLEDGSEPERPMTVRDTLMHMTGLPGALSGAGTLADLMKAMAELRGGADGTLDDLAANLATRPLTFSPGTRWQYGVSTDIVGLLVERISGQRFDDYLQQHLFGPLQMVDTGFSVPDEKIDRFSASYGRTRHKTLKLVDDPERSSYRRQPRFLSGGGGLVSTTEDYLRFARMLLAGGELDGVRVLGRKTVELMATNHLPGGGTLRDFAFKGGYGEVGFDGMGFGLTMSVTGPMEETQRIGSPGEFMWGGAASTIFWVDPVEDLTCVFMTQLLPSGTFDFRGQLKSIIYPSIVD